MKKNQIKIAFFLGIFALSVACEETTTVDEVLDEVGTGAILRTRDETNNLVYDDETKAFTEDSEYSLILEEQDEEGGALLQSVDIFVNFQDNSTEEADDTDITTEETLLQTLSASDFTQGERGLPETSLSYTADELVAATGIDESQVFGKDRFEFRLVLTLTNGEVYTNTDVGGPVSGGSYFASPFEYFPVVACAITESLAGVHTYEATNLASAPGAGGECSGNPVTGTVTWTETDDAGVYSSSDMSFGQFEDCYTNRGKAAGEDITIEWDCTSLSPDGEVYLNEDGQVIPNDDDEDEAFTYSYDIVEVTGPTMIINFSSSAGDRGTVALTRQGGADWPAIFLENNDDED